uniref:Uncharacterized protein n=1 Tax=Pediastrum duplex TaxID=3105 RepID=A0A1W5RMN6_PEDDU|nr:hypothetical protein [Pediastrum duplex]AQU64469.1 hypothetical protein [Pediastrum duplex]
MTFSYILFKNNSQPQFSSSLLFCFSLLRSSLRFSEAEAPQQSRSTDAEKQRLPSRREAEGSAEAKEAKEGAFASCSFTLATFAPSRSEEAEGFLRIGVAKAKQRLR